MPDHPAGADQPTNTDDPFGDVDPFDIELDGPAVEPPATSRVDPDNPVFGGINISELATALVAPAVQTALGAAVAKIAGNAVHRAMTPDVVAQLTADAEAAAAQSLDPTTQDDGPPRLYYGSTDEFVREYLRYVYRRPIDAKTTFWAASWWQYDEALARLEALWRAWEHLRLDPATGPSVWWRDHADPHMRALMSPDGPFSKCINTRATVLEPLPYEPPPTALFPDVRGES